MADRFSQELDHWGPDTDEIRPLSVPQAESYCRDLAQSHYENFSVVSWCLPKSMRQHFFNIYAYCRWSDDLADEVADADESLRLLDWWNGELKKCFSEKANHPVFIALKETVQTCQIPIDPFEDLLSAFKQDQKLREYDTFAELLDYCSRSANPVGRLILYISGQANEQNFVWSDSICTGLQLANFWQDVSRDYDIGRIYLPREDRDRFGYPDEQFERRETNQAFRNLLEFEVQRTRQIFSEGMPLIGQLPGRLQIDIELFARGGLKVLDKIEAGGYSVWEHRPVVSKFDFFKLFCGCTVRSVGRKLGLSAGSAKKCVESNTQSKGRKAIT